MPNTDAGDPDRCPYWHAGDTNHYPGHRNCHRARDGDHDPINIDHNPGSDHARSDPNGHCDRTSNVHSPAGHDVRDGEQHGRR